MHGRRQLPGGLEQFMRLGYADAVLGAFEPQVSQAVAEFPAVLAEFRARLPVADGPIGLLGASIGALPAQLVMADRLRAGQRRRIDQPGDPTCRSRRRQ